MASTPSYITKSRHGVFYFQWAVPRSFDSGTKVIRKSLRTKNRRHALALARKYWVEMNDKKTNPLNEIERILEIDNQLLHLGKKIYQDMNKHVQSTSFDNGEVDSVELDNFFEGLTFREWTALRAYNDYLANNPGKHGPSQPILTKNDAILEKLEVMTTGVTSPGKKLSELKILYLKDATSNPKKKLSEKTLSGYETDIDRLILFIGDIDADKITKDILLNQYTQRRHKLPKDFLRNNLYVQGHNLTTINGITKKLPIPKPIDEIIKIAETDTTAKFLSEKSISNEYVGVSTFIRWCIKHGYVNKNLELFFSDYVTRTSESNVIGFDTNDLKLIFESEPYIKGLLFNRPHLHWIPLLGLYQGMRIGEIATLLVKDVNEKSISHNGKHRTIWTLNLHADKSIGKSLKNDWSEREIPIHSDIINLGFITYVDTIKRQGETKLFPIDFNEANKQKGNKTSYWFNNSHDGNNNSKGFFEHCGVSKTIKTNGKIKKKVFHSLRHTWIDTANKLGLNHDLARQFTGHAPFNDVHARTYQEPFNLLELSESLERMNFGVDISRIKKWR